MTDDNPRKTIDALITALTEDAALIAELERNASDAADQAKRLRQQMDWNRKKLDRLLDDQGVKA